MKTKTEKQVRDGFYMNVTPEERKTINILQEQYAINISQAFKVFLKQMVNKMEKS